MRFLAIVLVTSIFLLTACEVEPSKSEKEAIALKEEIAKRKVEGTTFRSPDPSNPDSNVAIYLFEYKDRAEFLGKKGDVEGALNNLKLALKADPKDRRALRLYARATQKRAQDAKRPKGTQDFLDSADAARKCVTYYPSLSKEEATYFPTVFYNEACTHAVNGDHDRAFKALDDAVRIGFRDLGMIETDPDLESLRKRPEYEALVQSIDKALIIDGLGAKYSFPFRFELPDTEGKVVKLADFKGKVVLVEFWGSSYAPSRKEIPHLLDLDKRYRDKNLRVIGINYEVEQSENTKAAVQAFVKENEIPFPCLIGDEETRKQIPDFKGFPTTLFIGPDGRVRLRLSGYQTLSSLETAVAKLVGELEKPAK